jgi:hypothetical protein
MKRWIDGVRCPVCGGKNIHSIKYPFFLNCAECLEAWSMHKEVERLKYLKPGIKRQTIEIIYQETARAFTMDYLRKAVRDRLEKRDK